MIIDVEDKKIRIYTLPVVDNNSIPIFGGKLFAKILSSNMSETDEILTLAGHDRRKIDYAVPQSWADEYADGHNGEMPRAVWSYENSFFGEPLFWNKIIQEAIVKIETKFKEIINGL